MTEKEIVAGKEGIGEKRRSDWKRLERDVLEAGVHKEIRLSWLIATSYMSPNAVAHMKPKLSLEI